MDQIERPGAGGAVADFTIGAGIFAQAGQPLIAFVSFGAVWVEACLTENNPWSTWKSAAR